MGLVETNLHFHASSGQEIQGTISQMNASLAQIRTKVTSHEARRKTIVRGPDPMANGNDQ